MVESVQILAGLLGLVGSQGERNVLDFTLDVSKQIIGLWLLTLLGSSLKLSQVLAEATVGVGFEYVLLRSCSLLIFEQILQNKALRTGEYNDEDEEFDPMRYLHQLWIWLLCVCGSQYALIFFQLPSLCGALLQVLLAPFDWIDLEGPTMLVLCCLCRAFQFRLTDVLVLRRGGLAAPQAAALLTWGACAAAQAVLGAIAAVSEAVLEPSRLSEPLLDVEKADRDPRHSKGPARSALERRAAERPRGVKTVETLQSKDLKVPPAPPTTTIPTIPVAAASPRREQSPSPKKPKSGGTWTRGEEKNPRGPPKVLPVNAQVQSLKGMFAERDSDLKELHENLDELLKDFSGVAGLDALSPLPSFSPTETVRSPVAELPSGRSSPSFHSEHGFPGPQASWAPYPNGWTAQSLWPTASRQPRQEAAAPQAQDYERERETGKPDRRSRRYDLLDKKIDSLLTALGASPAPAPPAPSSFGAAPAPPEAKSIDQRIDVLQQKMEHLLQLREQNVPK